MGRGYLGVGLRNWSPGETLYVPYLARNIRRLECLEAHCRYYLGGELDRKPKGFMFFPKTLLPQSRNTGINCRIRGESRR